MKIRDKFCREGPTLQIMISIFEGATNVDQLRELAAQVVPLPKPRRVTLRDGEVMRLVFDGCFLALWSSGWILAILDGWSKNVLQVLFCSLPILFLAGAIPWEIHRGIGNRELVKKWGKCLGDDNDAGGSR